jgi:glyoxylase-like metal-dependent hydrolase (beta-lactamase superfamily II)
MPPEIKAINLTSRLGGVNCYLRPTPNSLVDDAAELKASVERVKGLGIHLVYPGHGRPFSMEELIKSSP